MLPVGSNERMNCRELFITWNFVVDFVKGIPVFFGGVLLMQGSSLEGHYF